MQLNTVWSPLHGMSWHLCPCDHMVPFICKRWGGSCVCSEEPNIQKLLDSLAHRVQRQAL